MPQDKESGAAAAEWGIKMAGIIGDELGAKRIDPRANEFLWHDRQVSIRCAHRDTTSVGIIWAMLDRVSAVLGGFQDRDGSYHLYELPAGRYREFARPASNDPDHGLVTRANFKRHGTFIKRLFLREPD